MKQAISQGGGVCRRSVPLGTLAAIEAVSDVQVDTENGRITLTAPDDGRARLVETLLATGYPEQGSPAGIQAAQAKAESFVSCAIGRMGS